MTRYLLSLAVVLAAACVGRGDILAPGAKWANHVAKIDGVEKYKADYVFFIYPRDVGRGRPGNTSVRVPDSGEVGVSGLNPLATRNGIFLFAIPTKLMGDTKVPNEDWFEGKGEGVLKTELPFHPQRTTDKSDKRDKIVTPCKLEIKDNKLSLTVIKVEKPATKPGDVSVETEEREFGSRWQWIFGGGATGLALMTGVWLAVRPGRKRI